MSNYFKILINISPMFSKYLSKHSTWNSNFYWPLKFFKIFGEPPRKIFVLFMTKEILSVTYCIKNKKNEKGEFLETFKLKIYCIRQCRCNLLLSWLIFNNSWKRKWNKKTSCYLFFLIFIISTYFFNSTSSTPVAMKQRW